MYGAPKTFYMRSVTKCLTHKRIYELNILSQPSSHVRMSVCWHQWPGSSLIQVMTCSPYITKRLLQQSSRLSYPYMRCILSMIVEQMFPITPTFEIYHKKNTITKLELTKTRRSAYAHVITSVQYIWKSFFTLWNTLPRELLTNSLHQTDSCVKSYGPLCACLMSCGTDI